MKLTTSRSHDLRYHVIPHASCSRELGTSDYNFFPHMRKWLTGMEFASNDEVTAGTTACYVELDKSYNMDKVEILEHQRTKCIKLKGNFAQK
ncbi:hypothetical protein AVEN_127574-1 [Araneus ventricosus]|uniref:Uncharacterized protein n=1 Tax=Araneus ventricosus TaxID=182803 RepID=A0A4Y2PJH6_ARAVE|nr:hypothetical protein AVEN_127574-1 [Araneus ventricosus]